MDFIIDFILHIDHYMVEMVQQYHTWTYAILFACLLYTSPSPRDS